MKLFPQTPSEWRSAALFAAAAPVVSISLGSMAAYQTYCHRGKLGLDYHTADGLLQAMQKEVFGQILGVAAILTLILCIFYLFADRRLAGVGFLVLVVALLGYALTPIIIHE